MAIENLIFFLQNQQQQEKKCSFEINAVGFKSIVRYLTQTVTCVRHRPKIAKTKTKKIHVKIGGDSHVAAIYANAWFY